LIRVPLIVKYPASDQRRGVVEDGVSIANIMPTVLEYVNHPVPATADCGTLKRKKDLLVAEIFRDISYVRKYGDRFSRDQKAIYGQGFKLIWSSDGKHELYHLGDDPAEQANLYEQRADVREYLQSKLDPLINDSTELASLDTPQLDLELRGRLKALGYVQ
jgi:arylsulfatase A-like enzyme